MMGVFIINIFKRLAMVMRLSVKFIVIVVVSILLIISAIVLFYKPTYAVYLNDELLGTYNCTNCAKTLTTIDDTEYHTNYFQNGTYERPAVLNPNVALINENGTDYAYSISSGLNSLSARSNAPITQVLILFFRPSISNRR